MLVNIIQNTISSFRSALAAAGVITTNLKMWLGFETSETLGAELVSNGDFSNPGVGDFTAVSGSLAQVSNELILTTTTTVDNAIDYNIPLVIGNTYKATLFFNEVGSSTNKWALYSGIYLNGTNNREVQTYGVHTVTFVATNAALSIQTYGAGAIATYSFDNFSVKELTQITPDKSGNNNVGELFTGKALEFDGSTNYVDLGNSISNTTYDATTKRTIVGWFQIEQISDMLFSQGTNFYLFNDGNGDLKLQGGSNSTNFGSTPSGMNRIVTVLDGLNVRGYINGVEVANETIPTFTTDSNNLFLGKFYNNAFFLNGLIADFQVYNSAWTQDDITYDYANPNKLAIDNPSTSLVVTNLKGYWAMSEGAGSLAYDSAVALGNDAVVDGDFPLPNANWDLVNEAQITVNGLKIDNTVSGNFVGAKQFLTNSPFGKTFVATYDITATNGTELAIQQAVDVTLDSTTIGTNKKTTFTWSRAIDELTIKRLGTGVNVTIDNFSLQEISVGIINGATYEPAQPRIPQLGMQNWAKSTPVADEITLIPNPRIPTQDIFGNAVRDRLNSFNLDGSGYAEVADDADLNFGTGDFTLECWVRIDGNTDRRLLDKRNTTSGYTLYLTSSNVLKLELNDNIIPGNIGFDLTSNLSSNTWLHLAIVCDRSANATCYVNKAAQTPVNISSKGGNIDSTSNLIIGADAPDGLILFSTDIISDVRLYKGKALSADEVENNYNAGLSAHTN